MDSIRIDTGQKSVCINDDPSRVITFNPSDVAFAERFYGLVQDFQAKIEEYQARANSIDPNDVAAGLALVRESCEYMRGRIDYLFGAGASQAAFGDALSLDAIGQFLDGMTPLIQTARSERIEKYRAPAKGKRVLK